MFSATRSDGHDTKALTSYPPRCQLATCPTHRTCAQHSTNVTLHTPLHTPIAHLLLLLLLSPSPSPSPTSHLLLSSLLSPSAMSPSSTARPFPLSRAPVSSCSPGQSTPTETPPVPEQVELPSAPWRPSDSAWRRPCCDRP